MSKATAKRKLPAEAVSPAKFSKLASNSEICTFLNELADYERNVSRHIHKYNAYRKASRAIAALDTPIASGKDAMKIEGVGKKIGAKIDEFLETGKLAKLDKIAADPKAQAIQLFTSVMGIGPAAAGQYAAKGLTTLAELEKEPGLTATQRLGLKHYDDLNQRIPRAEMDILRTAILESIKSVDDNLHAEVCGSYRRGAASSGDIDMLITHPEFISPGTGEPLSKSYRHLPKPYNTLLKRIVDKLEADGLIQASMSQGETKYMGICQAPLAAAEQLPEGKRRFRRIDLRLWPHDQFACALLYFTGSDELNKTMRRKAIEMQMKLSEYSLRPIGEGNKMGSPMPVQTEKDVFEHLDMEYLPPSKR